MRGATVPVVGYSDTSWEVIPGVGPKFGLYSDRLFIETEPMKLSQQVKPITYLKTHAAEMIRGVAERREPYVITQNGEAKAVLQDMASYEQMQETMALLKVLALGNRQIESGKTQSARSVLKKIREQQR
jgi:prevent-host-death family protein